MTSIALIHSPLLGPASWEPVARVLGQRDVSVLVPDLDGRESSGKAYWRQHAEAAAEAFQTLPEDDRPVLVGHSGAGPLLPAIREASARHVAGYVFVDAGLPEVGPRLGEGQFAKSLRELYERGGAEP